MPTAAEFLRSHEPYAKQPVLSELAALERALNDAFDGADAPVVSMADLLPCRRKSGAASRRAAPYGEELQVSTNVGAIWTALKAGNEPPPVHGSETSGHIIVWRHEMTPMFREMGAEARMMWVEAGKGVRFADL